MEPEPDAVPPTSPVADPPPAPAADRQPAPAARGPEPRRRKMSATERRFAGFGDDTDRACCAAYAKTVPPDFPVHLRTGAATLRMRVVARRPGAVLFCDGAHPGPHLWPLGVPVTHEEAEPDA